MTKTIKVEVRDRVTNEPLSQAKILAHTFDVSNEGRVYETYEAGEVKISIPENGAFLSLKVRHDGYVPQQIRFDERHCGPIPENYVILLERGIHIGGIVVNEKGEAVSGAQIALAHFAMPSCPGPFSHPDDVIRSDDNGRWWCDFAPSRLDDLAFRISHADYATTDFAIQPAHPRTNRPYHRIASNDLRSKSAIFYIGAGVNYTGIVTDTGGSPVARASVQLGDERHDLSVTVETDVTGRFTFLHCPEEQTVIVAQAIGFSPACLLAEPHTSELRFQLVQSKKLTGLVQTNKGEPISGAKISIHWIAFPPMRMSRNSPQTYLSWSYETDEHGRFVVPQLPDRSWSGSIFKRGFRSLPIHERTDGETVYTLMESPVVRGTVRDKLTKEPLNQFRLSWNMEFRDRPHPVPEHWLETRLVSGPEFSFSIYNSGPHIFKIEAPGYHPFYSESLNPLHDVTIPVELTPASKLSGMVESPNGVPQSEAQVTILTKPPGVIVHQTTFRRLSLNRNSQITSTNQNGQFELDEPLQAQTFAAIHECGYAEVMIEELRQTGCIRLKAWGEVEGALRIGSEPGKNENISIVVRGYHAAFNALALSTQTDSFGRFHFRCVPPGEHSIMRRVPEAQEPYNTTIIGSVVVRSCEVSRISIGGTGWTVTGQVKSVPEYPVQWQCGRHTLRRRALIAGPASSSVPRLIRVLKPDDLRRQSSQPNFLPVTFANDGTFRIEDVPPGEYVLSFEFSKPIVDRSGFGNPIGSLSIDVDIPNIGSCSPGSLFFVGEYAVRLNDHLDPGDVAPDFNLTAITGETLTLKKLDGRYVLLTVWPAYKEMLLEDLPDYRALYQQFSASNRLSMIAVVLGHNLERLKEFISAHDMPGHQVFLGNPEQASDHNWDAPLMYDYGITSLPSVFLIGPHRKIHATRVRLSEIASLLTAAMQ